MVLLSLMIVLIQSHWAKGPRGLPVLQDNLPAAVRSELIKFL